MAVSTVKNRWKSDGVTCAMVNMVGYWHATIMDEILSNDYSLIAILMIFSSAWPSPSKAKSTRILPCHLPMIPWDTMRYHGTLGDLGDLTLPAWMCTNSPRDGSRVNRCTPWPGQKWSSRKPSWWKTVGESWSTPPWGFGTLAKGLLPSYPKKGQADGRKNTKFPRRILDTKNYSPQ